MKIAYGIFVFGFCKFLFVSFAKFELDMHLHFSAAIYINHTQLCYIIWLDQVVHLSSWLSFGHLKSFTHQSTIKTDTTVAVSVVAQFFEAPILLWKTQQTVAIWMQLWLLGQFVSWRFKWVGAFHDYRPCCVFKARTLVILGLPLTLSKNFNQKLHSELSASAVWTVAMLFTRKSYTLYYLFTTDHSSFKLSFQHAL